MTIQELSIYTSQLTEQTHFYQHTLGLTLIEKSENAVHFKMGYSTLTLRQKDTATPYHIAIHIPSNKDVEALHWLKLRVQILKDHEHELIDFKNWNAKSMYFYDLDNNILELIARKNLKTETQEPFDQHQFLGISEIGVSVQNIADTYKDINALHKIDVYDGDFDKFCAVGDEQGLFIIIDQNKKHWFPTNDFAYSSDFIVRGDINLEFYQGQIKSV